MNESSKTASFWDHLDELRKVLFRIVIATIILSFLLFFLKDQLFDIVFAPNSNDFITYRIINKLSSVIPILSGNLEDFSINLINTQLTRQVMVHIKMAFYASIMLIAPYILYEIFRFVSPALYENERKYAFRIVISSYFMFMLGIALSYFVIFPITFRFLGSYQVSESIANLISLDSYISTLLMMNLMMGIVFEIPILCWLFAKIGIINAAFLRKYRKHAIVILLIIAAIITPTADIFTLTVVTLPMYLLYEISIWVVAKTIKQNND